MPSTAPTATCPDCGASVHRSHRRPLERFTSVIVPQYRYRCYKCGWTGLQRVRRSPLHIGLRGRKVVITRERMVIIVLCVLLAISLAALIAAAKI
jgi:predicted nucleic acid-binding Zn ribbon protein